MFGILQREFHYNGRAGQLVAQHFHATTGGAGRLAALDGLRGVLALTVALVHALDYVELRAIDAGARWSVWIFWALSGMVLARGFPPGASLGRFFLRRIVRLWPVHIACLGLAASLNGTHIGSLDVTLFPWTISNAPRAWITLLANPPSWSLCIEVPATLTVPLLAMCGRFGILGALAGIAMSLLLGLMVWPPLILLAMFAAGAGFATVSTVRFAPLEVAPLTALGRISYSIYLAHAPVLALGAKLFGPWGGVAALPLALLAGWAVWYAVERPSVWLARQIRYRPEPANAQIPGSANLAAAAKG